MTARVLVLRALGIGDLLTGVPALRAVRRAWPDAHLSLAAPALLAPLVELVGGVDELVPSRPLEPLPVERPDVAVNLHGRGPQSTALLDALHPARLIAWGRDGREWRDDEHEVLRWCRLLDESGVPTDPDDLHLEVDGVPGDVVVHPGAAVATRRWPASSWRSVVRGLVDAGRSVVVTGGPDEVSLADEVADGRAEVLAGRTSLLELVQRIAGARLLVAPDTGAGHVATAVGTRSVLLFGPVPPSVWGPRSGPHTALWAGTTSDPFAGAPDPGLLTITPDQVLAACLS